MLPQYIDTDCLGGYGNRNHLINIKPGQAMLEIGCGNGAVSKHIYDKYKINITGTDIDKEQIGLAKTNAKDLKNITFLYAYAANLPFKR